MEILVSILDRARLVFRFVYPSFTKELSKSTGLGLSHRIIPQTIK
jgi:hypothetical protein